MDLTLTFLTSDIPWPYEALTLDWMSCIYHHLQSPNFKAQRSLACSHTEFTGLKIKPAVHPVPKLRLTRAATFVIYL